MFQSLLRRASVAPITLLLLAACAADSDVTDEELVDTSEDALATVVTPRADGRFDVACQTSGGVTWSDIVTAEQRAAGGLCFGVPYEAKDSWVAPRDGKFFVYDKPEVQVARFMVEKDGTYSLFASAAREWLGDPSHAEADVGARVVLFVDGACAGSAVVERTTDNGSRSISIRAHLTAGTHTVGIALGNDYWDEARGLDRNVWVSALRVWRTSYSTTPPPDAASCAIEGTFPAPPPPASPFDDAACTGTGLTTKEMIALIGAGQKTRKLAPLEVFSRSRNCTSATGCGAWGEVRRTKNPMGGDQMSATPSLSFYEQKRQFGGVDYRASVSLAFNGPCVGAAMGTSTCSGNLDDSGTLSCGSFAPHAGRRPFWRADGVYVNQCDSRGAASARLFMTDTCMKFTATSKQNKSKTEWTETSFAAVSAL